MTEFGRSVVKKMNQINMFVDVSHLNEKSFWDVCEVSKQPIIATHSNAKKLCNHIRNLTDEQIKEVIRHGGFIGINLYSSFLVDEGKATIDDIMIHIEHILELGGENTLGFGADLDGCDILPESFFDARDYKKIAERLEYLYNGDIVEKITHRNLRVYINQILLALK